MSFTYDISTDLGKTRFFVADTVEADHLFEDEELTACLIVEAASDGTQYPRYAAAAALVSLATNYNRLYGAIQILDLKLDGPSMSRAFLAQADQLRKDQDRGTEIEIIEWVNNTFSARDRIVKQWLRLAQ